MRRRRVPQTFQRGDVTFWVPGDPPWWKTTRLGRAYVSWHGRRQLRGWTVLGYTDETGATYEPEDR